MNKRKVVSLKNLPTRGPLALTINWWLLLDRLKAAGWVWGATGLLVLLCWLFWIVSPWTEQSTDLFESTDASK